MWLVSAVAVAVLNLDAAVVLCTPLAITVARRWQIDPVALAFQPVLLACLASSALPVSNLTNLIAVAEGSIDAGTLVLRLGLPTLTAVAVGYGGWRVAFRRRALRPVTPPREERPSTRALVIGVVVIIVLLAGFLPGHLVGIEPWMVVAVVDLALIGLDRTVPWRSIPWGTAAVAAGLAIVAAAAAQRAGVASWLVADGTWGQALRGAAAANVLNNLPAFLVALPHVSGTDHVLALLFGVNAGPTILVTGSLAGLLWLDAARRHGLPVGGRDYARVGLVAGVPAVVAGIAVLALV
jgi:arsenical pump membrane protein